MGGEKSNDDSFHAAERCLVVAAVLSSARGDGKVKCRSRGSDEVERQAEPSKADGDYEDMGERMQKVGHRSYCLAMLCLLPLSSVREGHGWFHNQENSPFCYSARFGTVAASVTRCMKWAGEIPWMGMAASISTATAILH